MHSRMLPLALPGQAHYKNNGVSQAPVTRFSRRRHSGDKNELQVSRRTLLPTPLQPVVAPCPIISMYLTWSFVPAARSVMMYMLPKLMAMLKKRKTSSCRQQPHSHQR
jgi:hypothetical protein